jgi:hypothetical protein
MAATGEPYPEDDPAELPDDPRYDDADISTAPLVDQPAYGRGLWKKPITFVPPAPNSPPPAAPSAVDGASFAQKYLAIVLAKSQKPVKEPENYEICAVCGEPLKEPDDRAHFLTFTHQAALPRASNPSGIDRSRMGLKYLEKHGFDVDARVGLGASGQGILFPIVPKEKRDKYGLGVDKKQVEKEKRQGLVPKELKLDAGKIRKLEAVQKKKHAKLQSLFYGDDKVDIMV